MSSFTILIYIISGIVGWIIFYFVVKAAVKNGILEAKKEDPNQEARHPKAFEKVVNPAQRKLQDQYDKGEITFEEYKSQWNKLDK